MDASTRKRVRSAGPDAYVAYQAEHNVHSIDGLPAVPLSPVASRRTRA